MKGEIVPFIHSSVAQKPVANGVSRHPAQHTHRVVRLFRARTRRAVKTRIIVPVAKTTVNITIITRTLAQTGTQGAMIVKLAARHFKGALAHFRHVLSNAAIDAMQSALFVARVVIQDAIIRLEETVVQGSVDASFALGALPLRHGRVCSLRLRYFYSS